MTSQHSHNTARIC